MNPYHRPDDAEVAKAVRLKPSSSRWPIRTSLVIDFETLLISDEGPLSAGVVGADS